MRAREVHRSGSSRILRTFVSAHADFVCAFPRSGAKLLTITLKTPANPRDRASGLVGTALATRWTGVVEMKGFSLHPGVRDAMISVTTIAAILAVLALLDDRVRDKGVRLAGGEAAGGIEAAARVGAAGWSMVTSVQHLGLEQVTLGLFVVVAAVLTICMLRT